MQMVKEPRKYGKGIKGGVIGRYRTAAQILENFTKSRKIALGTLRGRSLLKENVAARREFALLCYRRGIGSHIIGYILERDSSTVMNYIKPSVFKGKRERYERDRNARRARSAGYDAGSGAGALS